MDKGGFAKSVRCSRMAGRSGIYYPKNSECIPWLANLIISEILRCFKPQYLDKRKANRYLKIKKVGV